MKKQQNTLRIVSLAPSATSILCAIGAKKALVGVTKWCADVAPVDGLPKLGDCWHMGPAEEVVRLKPNLVIGSVPYKQETVATLLDQPLNFLAMNPRTLADVYADIRMLGRIVARAKAAETLVGKMKREFAAVGRQTKKQMKCPRVYCEAWPNPRISSPPWAAELVSLCGGELVVPAGERVSNVQVAAAKPDIIVLAWAATGEGADGTKAYEIEEWQEIPAIRDKRVYVIRDEWLNTPGPPLVHGARALRKIIASYSNSRGGA